MRGLRIGTQRVADDTDVYVIAEIGHNHGGRLDRAIELVRQAASAGAHAVKLQKRDNRSLFTQEMFDQPYVGRNSYGPTYGAHREALEFGQAEYAQLIAVAADLDIHLFATAFDIPSVHFLADLGVPAIKIASGDLTNIPLMTAAAKSGRAVIISTGGGTMDDVRRAVDAVLPINPDLAVLQCTAVYPAAPEQLDLMVIDTFRREFPEVVVGLSGHDLGPEMSWIACALGARVIEKHVTLDRSEAGSDHHFSLEPADLADLVSGLRRTRQALGSPVKRRYPGEDSALLKMGKKVVAARDLPAGHLVTEADLAIKSPGDGLAPNQIDALLGRTLKTALAADENLRLDVFI